MFEAAAKEFRRSDDQNHVRGCRDNSGRRPLLGIPGTTVRERIEDHCKDHHTCILGLIMVQVGPYKQQSIP